MRQLDIKKEHDFQFTRKWFLNRNLPTFRDRIAPVWAGKPIMYLEIGVFEGMSMVWMCQHVLTHPAAHGIGIDPWLMTTKLDGSTMADVHRRADHNTVPYHQCQLIRGNSAEVLRRMVHRGGYAGIKQGSVDLCMIDGNHNDLAVLDDARLCTRLVKTGGHILFDDVQNDRQKRDHVFEGLQMFLAESKSVQLLWRDRYMECYVKTST